MKISLASSAFEQGTDVFREGTPIYRVPASTFHDDDFEEVVNVGGEAHVFITRRYADGSAAEPRFYRNLGTVEGLTFHEDHPRGCQCWECDPRDIEEGEV